MMRKLAEELYVEHLRKLVVESLLFPSVVTTVRKPERLLPELQTICSLVSPHGWRRLFVRPIIS